MTTTSDTASEHDNTFSVEAVGPTRRTPDARFEQLDPTSPPHYLTWNGLRQHYIDEGPRDAPVFLLLHGEPTWSFLYRNWIPRLVDRGFRCVAPDLIGFGRSDKPVHDDWYTIERHCENIRHLIEHLDLDMIHLVVQDWAGPIGLRQAVDMPDRFARLFILNTWLHHEQFSYSAGIKFWHDWSTHPDRHDLPTGSIVAQTLRRTNHDLDAITVAFDAPYPDASYKAGARRFPWLLPKWQSELGNAADQQRCFDLLKGHHAPIHIIFGDADEIFTPEWGRAWATQLAPTTTFDPVAGAGHFLQEDAASDVIDVIGSRLADPVHPSK